MKKVFLAFPFSQFCEEDKDILTKEAYNFFNHLIKIFKEKGIDYYSAHERENWGESYISDAQSTKFDFDAMESSDIVICTPGYPYSGGVHIELGWASLLKKKIYLFLEKGKEYSPLVTGISALTQVEIIYYEDFYKDILDSINNIIEVQNEEK